jgi:hypothetical protein
MAMTDKPMTTILRGACHCGNLKVALETDVDPAALQLRACQCSFCRRHGAVTTSDPAGRLRIDVEHPELLLRYRFALGITDFLICRTCGVYVAAIMEANGGSLGVVNVNVLDDREPFARPSAPTQYGTETVDDREARRGKVWTPCSLTSDA